jgi:hypothetical protein
VREHQHNYYSDTPDGCLRALGASDPRVEMDRIEMGKDKLLKQCYSWILENVDFQRWRDSKQSSLLWIKGDPGKGKTMMMIALAEELLSKSNPKSRSRKIMAKQPASQLKPCLVSYFFCQSTDSRLNNAISVLKGLIYLLVEQEKSLTQHIKKRLDNNGKGIFDGPNALYTLRLVLRDILNDSALPRTYLLIDGLDECNEGLEQLLETITDDRFAPNPKVKWLVASRNRPDIAERLTPDNAYMMISLEMNDEHIARAVDAFIKFKVQKLASRKHYGSVLEGDVRRTLMHKSEATFLWVALACKRLEKEPASEAQSILNELPAGLEPLYGRMMKQILCEPNVRAEYCKQILRSTAIVYRPLQLQELFTTTKLPDRMFDNLQYLRDLVERCGSFLTLRNDTVFFIHQSAKDYIVSGKGQVDLRFNLAVEHGQVTRRSLSVLQTALKQDICDLRKPGILRSEIGEEVVRRALYRIEYACCYWVYHLSDYFMRPNMAVSDKAMISDGGIVHRFLQEHLLHWLEALSLLQKISESILLAQQLVSVIPVSMTVKKSKNY